MRRILPLLLLWPLAAPAATLDLAFLPPDIEPQAVCSPDDREAPPDDLEVGVSEEDDDRRMLLFFLNRDIRNLSATDPAGSFDFILSLMDWRADLDPEFDPIDLALARIGLHVDAGRLADLTAAGLVDAVRQSTERLDNAQKMALAQYYLSGIGVAPDRPYAYELIRDAAYGGNVEALLSVARFALQGDPVPGWEAPLDLTVTLAFGGMLGEMNAGVCTRAERIAREYLNGDVVTRNPQIAYAWYRFAADLGGGTAAWRVVEFHLEADAIEKDDAVMLQYLEMAAARGFTLNDAQADRLRSAGGVDAATVAALMGHNFSADTGRTRPSIAEHFRLAVNLDAEEAAEDGPYYDYLRQVAELPTAPGRIFTALADETLIRLGRWAGEAQAMAFFEEAWRRGDGDGTRRLGQMLVRYRDDPLAFDRAASLLAEAAERLGQSAALGDLDSLYRCQAPDAPRLAEADPWARANRASMVDPVTVSATDLISLDPFKDPWGLAQIQSQALRGSPTSLANWGERMQVDPVATDAAHRLWAARVDGSDKALELFAELEFTLATNAAERDLAVELFRRVHLHNGVTSALDLAIALIEDTGRDPAVADEVRTLLSQAGMRGEGASIRHLARVSARDRTEAEVYAEFAQVIEERGDFLALMFAIPHVSRDKVDDYIDRAVSLMACGTKDADELGDAYAILGRADMTDQWRRIGLTVAGGHVLAKLGLADRQMAPFDTRPAPGPREVMERRLADGDPGALTGLYLLTADPDLPTWDPAAAAGYLEAILARGTADGDAFALARYRAAPPDVQALVEERLDVVDIFTRAANRDDPTAARDLALLLRDRARTPAEMLAVRDWLIRAAEGGEVAAMADLGRMLAMGLGGAVDKAAALGWLDLAAAGGDDDAADLARLLRLQGQP